MNRGSGSQKGVMWFVVVEPVLNDDSSIISQKRYSSTIPRSTITGQPCMKKIFRPFIVINIKNPGVERRPLTYRYSTLR